MDRKEIFTWVSEARLGHRQYLVDEIHRPIDRVSGPVQSLYYCLCFYAGHHLVKQAGDYPHCFFFFRCNVPIRASSIQEAGSWGGWGDVVGCADSTGCYRMSGLFKGLVMDVSLFAVLANDVTRDWRIDRWYGGDSSDTMQTRWVTHQPPSLATRVTVNSMVQDAKVASFLLLTSSWVCVM